MSQEAAKDIEKHGGRRVDICLWSFTKAMFDKATPSAWPHQKDQSNCPIVAYFTWEGKDNDKFWVSTMKSTLEKLGEKVYALSPSSKGLPYFINTALVEATTAEHVYRGNLKKLSMLRKKYDPNGVMDLAGGFRIPLPVSGRCCCQCHEEE